MNIAEQMQTQLKEEIKQAVLKAGLAEEAERLNRPASFPLCFRFLLKKAEQHFPDQL